MTRAAIRVSSLLDFLHLVGAATVHDVSLAFGVGHDAAYRALEFGISPRGAYTLARWKPATGAAQPHFYCLTDAGAAQRGALHPHAPRVDPAHPTLRALLALLVRFARSHSGMVRWSALGRSIDLTHLETTCPPRLHDIAAPVTWYPPKKFVTDFTATVQLPGVFLLVAVLLLDPSTEVGQRDARRRLGAAMRFAELVHRRGDLTPAVLVWSSADATVLHRLATPSALLPIFLTDAAALPLDGTRLPKAERSAFVEATFAHFTGAAWQQIGSTEGLVEALTLPPVPRSPAQAGGAHSRAYNVEIMGETGVEHVEVQPPPPPLRPHSWGWWMRQIFHAFFRRRE